MLPPPLSLSLTHTHKHLPAFWVSLQLPESVGGFHSRLVGGQNKRKFVHIVCRTMTINSQRTKILLFLSTNMAAMTSHANNQLYLYCFTPIVVRSCLELFCFLSFVSFALRHLCSGTHRRNRFFRTIPDDK